MRYLALCCDYDGTLATQGRISPSTVTALKRLITSGRRVLLVTGRQLDDLRAVCSDLDLFEYVVAENGGVLYQPATRRETALADPPPEQFLRALQERGVSPLVAGRVVVATWQPHETTVLATIRELGLELQVTFNKGAVMVLPAAVDKATGLAAALERIGIPPRNAVGIGDAEKDHAFLQMCACSVAVANAIDSLRAAADIVTSQPNGRGCEELIEALLNDDLAQHEARLKRRRSYD